MPSVSQVVSEGSLGFLEPSCQRDIRRSAAAPERLHILHRCGHVYGARIGLDQLPQRCPPLHERSSPQVLAVEVEEIEGKEHEPVLCPVDGGAQGIEVGETILVLYDDLAIQQRCLAGELGGGIDNPPIRPCPVPAMAGECSDLVLIDDDQHAVAVVLDLVNPPFSGGWFRHKHGDFRPDEAEDLMKHLP